MSSNTNPKLYALTTSYNFEQPVLGELTETIRNIIKELAPLIVSIDNISDSAVSVLNVNAGSG